MVSSWEDLGPEAGGTYSGSYPTPSRTCVHDYWTDGPEAAVIN